MRSAAAVAVAGLFASAASAQAAPLDFEPCGRFGFSCARLSVPLDHSGSVPGRISLLVKRREALEPPRKGVLVVLAGGPGQSATKALDGEGVTFLAGPQDKRDLVIYDQRGTGRSGVLRCRALERAQIRRPGRAAAECARRLGPRRAFYTSRDTADDLEALRIALGAAKLSLFGVSYGTRTAQAYALRYPSRVDRLVLDSVVAPDGYDAFARDTFATVPRVLRLLCGQACRSFTSDPARDVRRLVDRIAAGGALRGRVPDFRGRLRTVAVDREDLFQILLSGDFVPPLRLSFPGAVAAARAGDLQPLLRLHKRSRSIQGGEAQPLAASPTLYAATTCEEARLPWPRTAPLAQRPGLAAAAVQKFPEAVFRPFDRVTSLASDFIDLCLRWPQSPVSPVPGPGPLPNVPTLLIEGENDLRTPVETAQAVAAQLPRSKLVVVPGVGHSALAASSPGCAGRAYDAFFAGRRVVERCPRPSRERPPAPSPATLGVVKPQRPGSGTPGRAAVAAGLTLADVREDADATVVRDGRRRLGGGLRAGRYILTRRGRLVLRGVSLVGGLRVSGQVERFTSPRQRGTIRLSGRRAARGVLRIRGRRLSGQVGGRRVTARMPALLALQLSKNASASRIGIP